MLSGPLQQFDKGTLPFGKLTKVFHNKTQQLPTILSNTWNLLGFLLKKLQEAVAAPEFEGVH